MRLVLFGSAWALGIASFAVVACSKTQDRDVQSRPYVPSAAEQRRIDERRAEERRAEERRAEERVVEERRLEDERRALAAEERRLEEERLADEARRARRDEGRPVVGGGPRDAVLRATPASALANIAAARCDREVRCGRIGPKEKYRSRAACAAELQRDKRDDINSDVCPGGVREKELTECLAAIRDEDCNNPLDTIARLNACRTGKMCVK
jgi:hypothetical protein